MCVFRFVLSGELFEYVKCSCGVCYVWLCVCRCLSSFVCIVGMFWKIVMFLLVSVMWMVFGEKCGVSCSVVFVYRLFRYIDVSLYMCDMGSIV